MRRACLATLALVAVGAVQRPADAGLRDIFVESRFFTVVDGFLEDIGVDFDLNLNDLPDVPLPAIAEDAIASGLDRAESAINRAFVNRGVLNDLDADLLNIDLPNIDLRGLDLPDLDLPDIVTTNLPVVDEIIEDALGDAEQAVGRALDRAENAVGEALNRAEQVLGNLDVTLPAVIDSLPPVVEEVLEGIDSQLDGRVEGVLRDVLDRAEGVLDEIFGGDDPVQAAELQTLTTPVETLVQRSLGGAFSSMAPPSAWASSAAIPEPAAVVLVGSGLAFFAGKPRRRS